MDLEVTQIAAAVAAYATAAVAAYGAKLQDAAAGHASNATVDLGHRLLSRILRREPSRHVIESALADVAAEEDGSEVALRLQLRKVLTADPELAREVAMMLPADSFTVGAQHNHGSGTFIGRDFNYSRES
jgi:hypothetical protein